MLDSIVLISFREKPLDVVVSMIKSSFLLGISSTEGSWDFVHLGL